jgi:nicotinamide mononucleotide (NMN) deamidase PncC
MANAARRSLKADVGVGITGVAGPAQIEEKPAGTVYLAIDGGREVKVFSGNYPFSRLEVKRRAIMTALFQLRRVLLDIDG